MPSFVLFQSVTLKHLFSKLCWLFVLSSGNSVATTHDNGTIINIERVGDRYQLDVEVNIQAERAVILAALTDYSRLNRISPIITQSRMLEPGLVEMNMHGCFLVFCFDKIQTQNIYVTKHSVFGRIIPKRSDYKSGWSLWLLSDTPTGTRVALYSQFTPDFWVPPLIGSLIIKRSVKRQVALSIKALQELQSGEP